MADQVSGYILLTLIWELHHVAYISCQFCQICCCPSRIRQTLELPNKSQQNVVADLMAHPVDTSSIWMQLQFCKTEGTKRRQSVSRPTDRTHLASVICLRTDKPRHESVKANSVIAMPEYVSYLPCLGRRPNGFLGLSLKDRTILFLEILLDKTVSVG